MTSDTPSLPDGYDEHLRGLTDMIASVRDTLKTDHTLSTDQRRFARRLLFLASEPVNEAERILPEPDRDDESRGPQTPDPGNNYEDALTNIERELCWLIQSFRTEQPAAYHYDEAPDEKFTTALEYATALRDILPAVPADSPVLAEMDTISVDDVDPHVGGRGDSDGRWLEYQLQRALERWGYGAVSIVFSLASSTRRRRLGATIPLLLARRG